MLRLMQVYSQINDKDLFIWVFNDLDLEELGYFHIDDQAELINDLLDAHFGLFIECEKQLKSLTETIIKKQGQLQYLKYIG